MYRITTRILVALALILVATTTVGFAAEVKTFEPPQTVDGKQVVWQKGVPSEDAASLIDKAVASQDAAEVVAKTTTVPVDAIPSLWMGLDHDGNIWLTGGIATSSEALIVGDVSIGRIVPGKDTVRYRYLGTFIIGHFPSNLDLHWVEASGGNAGGISHVAWIKHSGQFSGRVLVYLLEYDLELEYLFHLAYPLPPDTGGEGKG